MFRAPGLLDLDEGVHLRPRILIIDDDKTFSEGLKKTLVAKGMSVRMSHSPTSALQVYRENKSDFDVALVDYHFNGSEITGSDLAQSLRSINKNQSIIFMTGHQEIQYMDSMLQTGIGRNFIRKGLDADKLIEPILKVVSEVVRIPTPQCSHQDELKRMGEIAEFGIAGCSAELHKIVTHIKQIRKFRSQFMIIGGSGSGKEALARGFKIPGKPFVVVDCSRFSSSGEDFLISEIFGHKKGAYTGADSDKVGAFEIARGGVIYFDELHFLTKNAQARLLRAIQENTYKAMGDTSGPEKIVDVTIVSATQPFIYDMIRSNQFLPDLFYRMAKAEIRLPDLCQRKDDIHPVAIFLAKSIGERLKVNIEFEPGVIREFEAYNWPNNVRNLGVFIEGAAMAARPPGLITIDSFRQYVTSRADLDKLPSPKSSPTEPEAGLALTIDLVERNKIIEALKKRPTVLLTAKDLGIPRTTLCDKSKRLKIDVKKYLNLNAQMKKQRGQDESRSTNDVSIPTSGESDAADHSEI